MKLSTIWTLRGLPIRERFARTSEAVVRWVAHRLPRRLAYWSLIDSGVRHMEPSEVVPEVTFMTVLERAGRQVEA
jgi:hypothetical protein